MAERLRVQFGALQALRGTDAERGGLAAFALVVVVTGLHVINAWFIEGDFLNMSDTWSLPPFASSALFLRCRHIDMADGSVAPQHGGGAAGWFLTSAIMFAFAVEVIADLHTRLENTGNLHTFVLILTPLVALTVSIAVARSLMRLAKPGALLLIGAAGLIVGTQAVAAYDSSVAVTGHFRDFLILVEEVGEMTSACLVLVAAIHARPTNQS